MNDIAAHRRRVVLREASEWLVRLQDDPLAESDLEAWGRWMAASPDHASAFDDVSALWDASAGLDSDTLQRARAQRTPHAAPPPSTMLSHARRRRVGRWLAGMAATVLVVVGAGYLYVQPAQLLQEERFATEVGERRHVALADGSTIDLDAGTDIIVRYGKDRRDIELRRGLALFSVAHAPERPLVVVAGPVRSQVLGTRFAVGHRAAGDVAVTVLEGHVRVSAVRPSGGDIDRFDATAGQQVDFFAAQGLASPRPVNAQLSTAWRGGTVVYQGERLSNVIADLNRYSRVPVRLQDPALGQIKVTGRWELAGTDRWLEGLAQAVGMEVLRGADVILLSRSGAKNNGPNRVPDDHGSGVD